MLTSAIAVLGTLLGGIVTYVLQRMTLERSLAETRREKRRQEFADALAAYASACTSLRRAEFNRARMRLESPDNPKREEARQETYRLRAEARSAYYLVRLLADPDSDGDLIHDARDVIELARLITAGPTTLEEVHKRSEDATAALDKVIDRANRRLRDSSS
jgi:hypothetical protein